jgi:drug/metabolite transporter (DMT)-like permease
MEIPLKTLILMIFIGIVLASHFAFWITSIELTSISSSVILVTIHPIIVAPFSYYFLKERLSIVNVVGILLSFLGVIILVYGNYGLSSFNLDTLEGNILAILGGIAAGLYILGGKRIRKEFSVISYVIIVYSVATIVLLFLCLIFNSPIFNFNIIDFLLIFLMAVIAGIFGHTLYNWSLAYVSASIASVALLGEPLFSTIFAIIIPQINQIPSEYTIFGGSIILLGIYMTSRTLSKESKKY